MDSLGFDKVGSQHRLPLAVALEENCSFGGKRIIHVHLRHSMATLSPMAVDDFL